MSLEDVAELIAEQLRGRPVEVRVRVFNWLLHRRPDLFALLLQHPPREDPLGKPR